MQIRNNYSVVIFRQLSSAGFNIERCICSNYKRHRHRKHGMNAKKANFRVSVYAVMLVRSA